MEKTLKLVTLGKSGKTPVKEPTKRKSVQDIPKKVIEIDKVSFVLLDPPEQHIPEPTTLKELIELDETHPNVVLDMSPPFYKKCFDFKKGKVILNVDEGDTVKLTSSEVPPKGKDKEYTFKVSKLKLSNLKDMTVIIALGESGEKYLAHNLIKVN